MNQRVPATVTAFFITLAIFISPLVSTTAATFANPRASASPKTSASPSASPKPSQSPKPLPTPRESLTPDEILAKAEDILRANPDPPYIMYKMHEVFVHHGKRHEYDYQVWYRTDGKGLMQNLAPGRRGKNETFFGYPFPSAPDINILMYATPPPSSTPPPPVGTPAPGSSSAPVAGHEHIRGERYYVVSFAALESYNGRPVYHLTLRSLVPGIPHPWTDVWIDIDTFQVWKAHADTVGSLGPLTGRGIADAEFAPIGNFWMVKQLTVDAGGHLGFISDSGHYEYYFSDFGFPNTLPDWYFNEADFDKHRP